MLRLQAMVVVAYYTYSIEPYIAVWQRLKYCRSALNFYEPKCQLSIERDCTEEVWAEEW